VVVVVDGRVGSLTLAHASCLGPDAGTVNATVKVRVDATVKVRVDVTVGPVPCAPTRRARR
jgi:hypothetical protein